MPIILRGSNNYIKLSLNYLSFCIAVFIYLPYFLINNNIKNIFCYGISPFIQAFPVVFWSKIFKIKSIINVQDLWPQSLAAVGVNLPTIFINLIDKIVAYIYKNSDLLMVQSKGFINHISKYKYKKIIYWPNSFLPFGNNSETLINWPVNNKNKTFLFAGNIGKAQKLEIILEVFSSINQVNIIILGDGSEKNYLFKKFHIFNNIIFIDGVSPIVAQEYMKLADILLLSLESNYIFDLTIPNKLQAYLYSSKPILGVCCGSSSEIIIESKSGLVSNFDSNNIKEKIFEFISKNNEELFLMGKNGYSYYLTNFNHNLLIEQLENFLE